MEQPIIISWHKEDHNWKSGAKRTRKGWAEYTFQGRTHHGDPKGHGHRDEEKNNY